MSEQAKQAPTPKAPVKLPKGARLSRHGNVIVDGTEKVRDDS